MLVTIKRSIKKNISPVLMSFFIGLFFIDIILNINVNYFGSSWSRLSGYYKLLFEFFLILTLLLFDFKKVKLLLGFLGIFIIGQLSSKDIITAYPLENITTGNLYYFNRYIYIFIFIYALNLILKNSSVLNPIISLFKRVMFLNSFLILVGFIFNINLLRSYPNSYRFGFDGIFVKDGDAAYLYMIFIAYLYFIFFQKRDRKSLIYLLAIVFISLLLGKKVMFLFNTFLVLYYLYFTKFKKWIIPLCATMLLIMLFFYEKILNFFPLFNSFYKENGLITLIFSTRDIALMESYSFAINNWSFQNYLFGSIEYIKNRVELELFDLLFFFGIFGTIFYMYIFYKAFYKNNNKLLNQLITIILLTSLFSGALLISVPSLLFLYIILVRKENRKNTIY